MDKEKAIKVLRELLMVEESVIPLYSRHVENSLFLSGMKKACLRVPVGSPASVSRQSPVRMR